jgi:hypothetical protein
MIITDISYEYDNYSGRNITLRLRDYNGSAPNMSYMVGHDVNITLNDIRNNDYNPDLWLRGLKKPISKIEATDVLGLKDKLHTPKEPTEPISQPVNSIMGIDL